MLSKQISFNEGKISLLGQRFVILPADSLIYYVLKINKDVKFISKLYNSAKQTVAKGFGVDVGRNYSFSFGDYTNWFVEIAKFGGWGIIKWEELEKESHKGVISIENSPIGVSLKGKVNSPCDHIIRGFIAGGASSAFKSDVDVIETECIATGSTKCILVIDSNENLKLKYKKLYETQLMPK